jgi:hypothetical protein
MACARSADDPSVTTGAAWRAESVAIGIVAGQRSEVTHSVTPSMRRGAHRRPARLRTHAGNQVAFATLT